MRLIGMLDSPYVRRVAVTLRLLDLPFAHEPVSVFRHYDAFAAINPVVKAPTLVTDDGVVLMDSSVIIEHLERLAGRRLGPGPLADHARAQRIVGLALAACEKTVSLVYEFNLRPQEKHHAPWIDRVRTQLGAAWSLLEAELASPPAWLEGSQAWLTSAVAWTFAVRTLPESVEAGAYPSLAALTARAEATPAFQAAPFD
ncbi:glutathione S-transferase family protein [Caulobacter sp. BK020]|uniref:glutathione S-transferase family protein n=1 Tax=Caulobacter sp. BK020 TaxID=2512117 RepID=UPI00104B0DF4|nr:glutathione S-transferase family protein [Caulobacter sp. BK020]TCS12250.1 glutathione S-transferase [Caulobacter sp. BK020]